MLLILGLLGCSVECRSGDGCAGRLEWTWTFGGGSDWSQDFEDPDAAAAELGLAVLEGGPPGPGVWTGVFPVDDGWAAGVWAVDACDGGELLLQVPRITDWCGSGGGDFTVDAVLIHDGGPALAWLEPEGGLPLQAEATGPVTRWSQSVTAAPVCQGAADGPWLSLRVDAEGCASEVIWAVEGVSWTGG